MPTFSKRSLEQLATVDRRLFDICSEAIKVTDFVVLCGHRNQEDQEAAFQAGTSKLHWPDSKHNFSPSQAVDLAPYPISWSDINRFKLLSLVIKKVASDLQIGIEWGGDFPGRFKDYPHYQLA